MNNEDIDALWTRTVTDKSDASHRLFYRAAFNAGLEAAGFGKVLK